jgi:hypothetical protein
MSDSKMFDSGLDNVAERIAADGLAYIVVEDAPSWKRGLFDLDVRWVFSNGEFKDSLYTGYEFFQWLDAHPELHDIEARCDCVVTWDNMTIGELIDENCLF